MAQQDNAFSILLNRLQNIDESVSKINLDLTSHRSISEAKIGKLESSVGSVEKDVNHIIKIVRDGNGRPPLVIEIELLKDRQEKLLEKMYELNSKHDELIEKISDDRREEAEKSNWFIQNAIAVIALLGSLASAIFSFFSNKS